jgi:hypothetical protein
MNTRAFLIAIIIILLIIIGYVSVTREQLQPDGSLTNMEISPPPLGEVEPAISNTVPGQL